MFVRIYNSAMALMEEKLVCYVSTSTNILFYIMFSSTYLFSVLRLRYNFTEQFSDGNAIGRKKF